MGEYALDLFCERLGHLEAFLSPEDAKTYTENNPMALQRLLSKFLPTRPSGKAEPLLRPEDRSDSIPGVSIIPKKLTSFPSFDTTIEVDCRATTNVSAPGIYHIKSTHGRRGGSDKVVVGRVVGQGEITRVRLFPSAKTEIIVEKNERYSISVNGLEYPHLPGDCDFITDFLASEPQRVYTGDHVRV